MQIFVQTPTDKTIELNVLPSDTVKELKQKSRTEISVLFMVLSFKENGCTCCCYIQILFKIPTGEILELDALPSDIILGLNRLSNVGIKNGSTLCCFITIFVKNLVDQQRMIFACQQLEDHRKLTDYGVRDDSNLQCVLKLRSSPHKK
ncbi:45075_t:CDS:2 [Gigaspora margarita]|uniref:45075_t:CDS:1 n=1 Tax=Gigaspora margarita TaxID=4874 RepID=A0ABN7WL56_GIGMA|nr:45075_t:CDS:2 [Gigaspora margarita]